LIEISYLPLGVLFEKKLFVESTSFRLSAASSLIVTHKYHFPGEIVEKTKSEDMLKTHPLQEKDVRYSEQKTQL